MIARDRRHASMRNHRLAVGLGALFLAACRDGASPTQRAESLAASAVSVPSALGVTVVESNGRFEGRVAGDSTLRVRVVPRVDDRATARLCGHLATRSVAASAIPFGLPIDTTMPPLAIRLVEGDHVSGLRYLVPGAQGFYVFEGISRDGSRRVSVRWPVVSDPSRPIPANAADSLIEAALSPRPFALDSVMQRLHAGTSGMDGNRGALPSADSARAIALPLVRDYPDQTVWLSDACPQVTILLPVLARIDQRLRIPVSMGDRVVARGLVDQGSIVLSFDEAEPQAESRTLRQSVPEVAVTAPRDGRVSLRVRLQVVPRIHRALQPVVLSVGRQVPSR